MFVQLCYFFIIIPVIYTCVFLYDFMTTVCQLSALVIIMHVRIPPMNILSASVPPTSTNRYSRLKLREPGGCACVYGPGVAMARCWLS